MRRGLQPGGWEKHRGRCFHLLVRWIHDSWGVSTLPATRLTLAQLCRLPRHHRHQAPPLLQLIWDRVNFMVDDRTIMKDNTSRCAARFQSLIIHRFRLPRDRPCQLVHAPVSADCATKESSVSPSGNMFNLTTVSARCRQRRDDVSKQQQQQQQVQVRPSPAGTRTSAGEGTALWWRQPSVGSRDGRRSGGGIKMEC